MLVPALSTQLLFILLNRDQIWEGILCISTVNQLNIRYIFRNYLLMAIRIVLLIWYNLRALSLLPVYKTSDNKYKKKYFCKLNNIKAVFFRNSDTALSWRYHAAPHTCISDRFKRVLIEIDQNSTKSISDCTAITAVIRRWRWHIGCHCTHLGCKVGNAWILQ